MLLHLREQSIAVDAGKAFDTVQHAFLINVLGTLGIDGTHFKIIKSMYNKPIASIILNGETETIPSKIKNETTHSPLSVFKVLAIAIRQEKDIK